MLSYINLSIISLCPQDDGLYTDSHAKLYKVVSLLNGINKKGGTKMKIEIEIYDYTEGGTKVCNKEVFITNWLPTLQEIEERIKRHKEVFASDGYPHFVNILIRGIM